MGKIIKTMILTSLLFAGLAAAGCSFNSTPATETPSQIGSPAPDFQLQTLDGQTISLSSLRGKPVMINFWASWCGPCQSEMPFIQSVYEDENWKQQGLVILAINIGEKPADVEKFMEENDFSFMVLLDQDTSVAGEYNVSGIPATFFVDKDGMIKEKRVGAFPNKAGIDWLLVNSILEGS